MTTDFGRTRAGYAVVMVVMLSALVAGAQDQPKRKSKAEQAAEKAEKLVAEADEGREQLEAVKRNADQVVTGRFDRLIEQVVDAGQINVQERAAILADLKEAKRRFVDYGQFVPMPLMQQTYYDYVLTLRRAHDAAQKQYQKAYAALTKNDPRRDDILEASNELSQLVSTWDALQPNTTWNGFRSDFLPPPRVVFDPKATKPSKQFRIVQDGAGTIDFSLRVLKRNGNHVTCEVSQSEGDFRAIAEGTFDGFILAIKMTEMRRGAVRYFEYKGQIIGSLGLLDMGGYSLRGLPRTGKIGLQREL